jgi:hypothetical protein
MHEPGSGAEAAWHLFKSVLERGRGKPKLRGALSMSARVQSAHGALALSKQPPELCYALSMSDDQPKQPTATALISAAAAAAFRAGEQSGAAQDAATDNRVDRLAGFIVKTLAGLLVLSIIANLVLAAMVLGAKLDVSQDGVKVEGTK